MTPDVRLLLAAGALQFAAAPDQLRMVVLVGRPGAFDAARHDGVRSVVCSAEGMRLHVDAAACDAVLAAALAAGLSVRRVGSGG